MPALPAFFKRYRRQVLLACTLLVVFLAYLPSLNNEFVTWDDQEHLLNNLSVRGLDTEHLNEMFTSSINKVYIPLTTLSFAVEYRFFGLDPFVYHLDNVLLHLLATALVFVFFLKLGMGEGASALAALCFGLHPMRVESVSWVTERKDVLYAVFYLAALVLYLRYLEAESKIRLALVTILGLLSMLAKPMALSLPLVLILLDWFKSRRLSSATIWEKAPLFAVVAAVGWLTYSQHVRVPIGHGLLESSLTWIWSLVFYVRQYLLPLLLVPVYNLPKPVALANPEYLLSGLVLAVLAFFLWRSRNQRWIVFAFAFYFLSIFFLLRFDDVKDTNVVADRFMYLPGLGFCALFGLACESVRNSAWAKGRFGRLATALGVLLVLGLLQWKTTAQSLIWKDSITLLKHQLAFEAFQPFALDRLATAYREKAEYQQAVAKYRTILELRREGLGDQALDAESVAMARKVDYLVSIYQEAIRQDPTMVEAYFDLGNLYKEAGMVPEALKMYQRAIVVDPGFKDAYLELGVIFVQLKEPELAVTAFQKVLSLDPEEDEVYVNVIQALNQALSKEPKVELYPKIREQVLEEFTEKAFQWGRSKPLYNLGVVYAEAGDFQQSLRAFRTAIERSPANVKAIYAMGKVYERIDDLRNAIDAYNRALRLDPRFVEAYLSLSHVAVKQGKLGEALDLLKTALKIDPNHANSHFNLGYLCELSGQKEMARDHYQRAIELDPSNADAYYNLGNVKAGLGDIPAAIDAYKHCVALKPDHMDAFVNLAILSFKEGDYEGALEYNDAAQLLGYKTPVGFLNALETHRKR